MKKSRKHRESSDFSDEDRHAHKYSRHAGHYRDKHLADDMTSPNPLAADDRHDHHKHGKNPRHRQGNGVQDGTILIDHSSGAHPIRNNNKASDRDHYKHSTADRPCHGLSPENQQPMNTHGHEVDIARSDSSDEILIKHRASRRLPRSSGGDDIARQIKNIEKAQREALRPSSAESQEIHIHYVPIVTRSASPPRMDCDDHHPLSSAATDSEAGGVSIRKSLAQGLSANDVKSQLKDLTMSWFTKRSAQKTAHTHRCPSPARRNKPEKRDKHGKKKVAPLTSTSKYLAPLAQRWVCYKCGKIRSDSIQDRYPLRAGKKMQPNWCGKCRVNGELKGRPLSWNGQRHYCWGCGIVRSERYHHENSMAEGEKSIPNYCKRCRELSPSFEYNLREASEIGSEVDLRDQAFRRQMYDASMSDIDEDEDNESTNAPGKENEDPNKPTKLKATKSFILKHGASVAKTSSDSSFSSASEGGGVPTEMLEAMHLDADRARSSSSAESEHSHVSSGSYKPPFVESLQDVGDRDVEMQDAGAPFVSGGGNSSAQQSSHRDGQHPSGMNRGCQTEADSPTILASTQNRASASDTATSATSNKKKVRWSEESSSRPATADGHTSSAPQPYLSDSGFSSSGYRSDVSMPSISSVRGRLRRLHPGEYSTGSPPRREGRAISAKGDDANDGPPVPPFACEPTLSRHPCATNDPPTPPDSHDHPESAAITANAAGQGGEDNASGLREWSRSPDQKIPNFSRPYQSPQRDSRTDTAYFAGASYVSSPGYGTRPDYLRQHQQALPTYPIFSSATHFSDSATRRDFSGFAAAPVGEDGAFHQQYMTSSYPFDADGGVGYYAHDEHDWDSPFEEQDQQQSYPHHSHNAFESFPAPPGYSAFDFSYLDHAQTSTETKFVRRKKTNSNNNAATRCPTMTPSQPQHSQQQWYLCEDDGATFGTCDSEGRRGNYKWQDGRTTIHRSASSGPSSSASSLHQAASGSSQPRNIVTILSIREITSDEELNGSEEKGSSHNEEADDTYGCDYDTAASDLPTIIQSDTPSTICQA